MKQIFFLFFLCCHVAGAMDQQLSSPTGDDTGTKTLTMSVLVREPALKSTNVTTPGTVIPGIDPRVLAMLEVSIEQRIMANLSSSLQVAFAQTREEAERMRREVESSNRESQLLRETIGFQATRVQELENRLRKEEVERTFLQCKIDAKPVPQRIEEMSADIIRKATIQEKNSSVAAICERLVPFSFLLPVEKLRIIEEYITNTKVKELSLIPEVQDTITQRMRKFCTSWAEYQRVVTLVPSAAQPNVIYYNGMARFGYCPDRINAKNNYIVAGNLGIQALNETERARYSLDIERANAVPFPSTELDDLITQFNGLLALHVE